MALGFALRLFLAAALDDSALAIGKAERMKNEVDQDFRSATLMWRRAEFV